MKIWILLLILMPSIAATGCAMSSWTLDSATISKLESSIKPEDIPTGGNEHRPAVSAYSRYYVATMVDGHRMIHGEWVMPFSPKMKPVGVYIVGSEREFPVIFDGGCGIVHLVYDVETARIVSINCNGYA